MKRSATCAFAERSSDSFLASQEFPDGPKSFSDLHSWPNAFLERFESRFPEESQQSLQRLRGLQRVILSTSFSGMGTPEVALKMISAALQQKNIWDADRSVVYAACDSDALSRNVLCNHGCRGAEHVFSDVCSTAPPAEIEKIKNFLEDSRNKLTQTPVSEQPRVRKQLEKKVLSYCHEVFARVSFNKESFCEKCQKQCSRFRAGDDQSNSPSLTAEVGGSPCIPFVKGGAYGTQLGWLHSVSVAFFSWIYSVKDAGIDVIVHECVPNFDPAVLEECLKPLYSVQSLVWNATDEGLPVRRERRYTICIKTDLGQSCLEFSMSIWTELAFCKLVSSGDIYLQASTAHIESLRAELCIRKGLSTERIRSTGEKGKWAWEVLMSKSERDVLLAIRRQSKEQLQKERSTDLSNRKWLVNLSQSISFQPRYRDCKLDVIPALLRSSKFFLDCFDEKKSRFVHPLECMAMQGFPVLLPAEHYAVKICNMEKTLQNAGITSLRQMASLSGNGMNLSSVGQVLSFALVTAGVNRA